jgi:hypothetical protein
MRLFQNQVYQKGEEFFRVVRVERLKVRYKPVGPLMAGEGEHVEVSKKEFCRLIKGATLLSHEEVEAIWLNTDPLQ